MVLCETLAPPALRSAKILGTDVSPLAVATARRATYAADSLAGLDGERRRRFFTPEAGAGDRLRARSALRRLVHLAPLNLLAPWPMRGPFDFIFCRNVMIYFPKETRVHLVEQFRSLLRPGGYFFLGLAESLDGDCEGLQYLQPAVYRKPEAGP
jgi:chemotaxis protein methyltransferase CheR